MVIPKTMRLVFISSLIFLMPQLAQSATAVVKPGDKVVKICNNFSDLPIWVRLTSTPVGGIEKAWNIEQITPLQCTEKRVTSEYWNAGRAYIYDRDPGLTKEDGSDGNFQLVEFTFRDPSGSAGTLGRGIGYNYSAVDSISSALPLAVEATDFAESPANSFAYTGNHMTNPTSSISQVAQANERVVLSKLFQRLVDAGWPYFPHSSAKGVYKIPGGYNLFALNGNSMLRYSPTARKPITAAVLTKRWTNWVDGTNVCNSGDKFCFDFANSVKVVWNGFLQNALHHGISPTPLQLAQHITGYVNFGNDSDWTGIDPVKVGQTWIALAAGIPNQNPEYAQYKYPDYNSRYNLNPYVTAIHKIFKMNVYAFSIDDSLGYFDAPIQDKLIIAVGGLQHLPNQKQAQGSQSSPYHLNLGSGWSKVQACSGRFAQVMTLDANTGSSTPLPLSAVLNSCQVTFLSDSGISATVKLDVDNNNMLQMGGCVDNANRVVCNNVYLNTNTNKDVQGPAAPIAAVTNDFLALADGYESVTSTACTVSGATHIGGKSGQYKLKRGSSTSCDFTFSTSGGHAVQMLVTSAGTVNCPTCRAQPNVIVTEGNMQIYMPPGSAL